MASRASISAILVTRDRALLLADALQTVARQDSPPLEVRIADDGTVGVSPESAPDGLLEVTWIPVAVGQAGQARNLAARGARGEVLAFLDDDDRWLPGHLAGFPEAFRDPAVELAYRDSIVIRERFDESHGREDLESLEIARDWDPEVMKHDDFIAPSAWAVRRSTFERLGGFDPAFRYSEDWDFLLRLARGSVPRRIPGATVEVRLRDAGNTSAERGPERQQCLDLLSERHGLPRLEIKTFWEVARDLAGASR